jgi:hypothetical protein
MENHTDSPILDRRRGEESTVFDSMIGLAEAPETDRDAVKENVLDAHVGDLCGIWRMTRISAQARLIDHGHHSRFRNIELADSLQQKMAVPKREGSDLLHRRLFSTP